MLLFLYFSFTQNQTIVGYAFGRTFSVPIDYLYALANPQSLLSITNAKITFPFEFMRAFCIIIIPLQSTENWQRE